MEDMPLVSVVIPFYSEKKWLDEALESVLEQNYSNKEILVINDGSKEDISDLKEKYAGKVKFQDKENGGPATARNLGIEMATGKYIAFLDSDDLWLPRKLEKQVELMEKNKAVWSQHSYEMFWDNTDKTKIIDTSIYNGDVYKDCFISFKVQTSCIMIKREVLINENIRFPINKRYGQDCCLFRMLAKKYKLYSIKDVYSRFRIRGNNAGFRAIVQINDRADIWSDIKDDDQTLKILPKLVKLAYRICDKESKFIKNKKIKNEKFAKFIYIMPWTMFKIYAK